MSQCALQVLVVANAGGCERQHGRIGVYRDLIFRRDENEEFTANRRKLLEQYCKLDTAAMVMIWKHWSRGNAQP